LRRALICITATALGLGCALAAPAGAKPAKSAKSAKPRKPAVRSCAIGRPLPSLRKLIPSTIARDQDAFARSLHGVGRANRRRATKAFAAGEAAYLYGLPTVVLRLTVKRFPKNLLVGVGRLATPDQRTVVAPNHDTLYSVSQLDLTSGPLIVDAPATGGRYSVLQLLDAYTNAFAYIGSGAERDQAESVALVPPGWQGSLPAGVEVIQSPTRLVWLLGRTLVDGPSDLSAATDLMRRYSLTPVADWVGGKRDREVVIASPAGDQSAVVPPSGLPFFDSFGQALAADPPPPRDACALGAFAAAGIGAGLTPSTGSDPLVARALTSAASAGARLVHRAVVVQRRDSQRRHQGWAFSAADVGRFGTDYAYRAAVASVGLAGNTRSEAFYPNTDVDGDGKPLSGHHRYVLTFKRGQLPPVRAFWSLTMYDQERFLVANQIDRYSVGDHTPGLGYGRRGGLKIFIQHSPPSAARQGNWLPAPAGRFELHLRLYEPKPAATNGKWRPPTITRVR
jgi:hypothetical protein